MLEAMLQPHMVSTGAGPFDVACSFVIVGLLYSIFTPLVGMMTDHIAYPTALSLLGNVLYVVVMLFVGPASFVSVEPSVRLIHGMMVLTASATPSSWSPASARRTASPSTRATPTTSPPSRHLGYGKLFQAPVPCRRCSSHRQDT